MLEKICDLFYFFKDEPEGQDNASYIPSTWGPVIFLRKNVNDLNLASRDASKLVKVLMNQKLILFNSKSQSNPQIKVASSKHISKPLLNHLVSNFWLSTLNKQHIIKLKFCLDLTNDLLSTMKKISSEIEIEDFIQNFTRMSSVLEKISKVFLEDTLNQFVVQDYHLQRFHFLLNDFSNSWKQYQDEQQLQRVLISTRMRGGFEKIALYAHYELTLWIHLQDFSKSFSQKLNKQSSELFVDAAARNLWVIDCHNSFLVTWSGFIRAYQKAMPNLTKSIFKPLKLILDNNNTGFVTILRFQEFLKTFGPFEHAIHRAVETAQEKWFHGYMSREESTKMLEPFPKGTFLVRFSASQPGAVALSRVVEQGNIEHTKLESTSEGFALKTPQGIQYFKTISDIVKHNKEILNYPFEDKIMQFPAFYGDVTTEEVANFLEQEPNGTYLVRFSSHPCAFTVSYVVGTNRYNHVRLTRTADGRLMQGEHSFSCIEELFQMCFDMFEFPYLNISSISSILSEDNLYRNEDNLLVDEDNIDNDKLINSINYLLNNSLNNSEVSEILNQIVSNAPIENEKILLLEDYLAFQSEERTTKLIKTALKDEKTKLKKSKIEKSERIIKGFKCNQIRLEKTGASLFKSNLFSFNILTPYKLISWEIRDPNILNDHVFYSCSESNGILEKNKTLTIQICVVLYKPVIFQKLLIINLKSQKGIAFSFPLYLYVSPSQTALIQEEQDPYWKINLQNKNILNKIGGGASASVFKCNLYGTIFALKSWDLGKKDQPPLDFLTELDIYKKMRHKNLVFFVGGCSEIGSAFLVTEFISYGSLDQFLFDPPSGIVLDFKLKIQMALDISKGMRFIHHHNKIHRDLKSLNLLVDSNLRVKVTDFGESKDIDSNMTVGRGTVRSK